MAQQEGMNMISFMEKFGTDEKCREYLYKVRWPEGFICPKCGAKNEPFQIKSRNLYQCRHCSHQASVTAGTIMDGTRTPLRKWFLAMYLMGSNKRGCSALRLKRELGIAYDTAWTMSHKIRKAMGDRDDLYLLQGTVDMDEAFFGSPDEGGKRGRGSDKTPVAVALSLGEKGEPCFVKAQVLKSVDGEAIKAFAKETVQPGAVIQTDGLNIYPALAENGYVHKPRKVDPKNAPEHLKWLHIIVSNMKAFVAGTYHGLNVKYFQAYLDEFCFRFNRRRWQEQLFARTLAACASAEPFPREKLVMSRLDSQILNFPLRVYFAIC
jgi:transposase-like protein